MCQEARLSSYRSLLDIRKQFQASCTSIMNVEELQELGYYAHGCMCRSTRKTIARRWMQAEPLSVPPTVRRAGANLPDFFFGILRAIDLSSHAAKSPASAPGWFEHGRPELGCSARRLSASSEAETAASRYTASCQRLSREKCFDANGPRAASPLLQFTYIVFCSPTNGFVSRSCPTVVTGPWPG